MRKITKIQRATLVLLMIYGLWEIRVQLWMQSEPTVPIRVDLVIILPVLLVMVILSVIQYIVNK